ncbi:Aconitate hydratase, mitochondrial, partial [Geodia barretti]
RKLHQPAARPGGAPGRYRSDGYSPVHAVRTHPGGGAHNGALRPPDSGPGGRFIRPAGCPERKQRGVPVPGIFLPPLRHGILASWLRHRPPGGAGKVCFPRLPYHRHRLPYSQWRRFGFAGYRSGWRRRRRRNGRAALGGTVSADYWREADRLHERLDGPQGRHHQAGLRVDGVWRHQRHHRVLWARRAFHIGHRQGNHLQHGCGVGATGDIFPYDERMATYLKATGRAELATIAEEHKHLLTSDPEVEANPELFYDRVVEIDLSTLEPHVTGPHSPDRARPISELAAEVEREGFPDTVAVALVGSCTNSSYEDMERCADVARQAAAHGVSAASGLLVTPGSEQVRATIERDGQQAALEAVGATVLANACGPCIGQWNRPEARGTNNSIVTSYNRNFPSRNDGNAGTMNFIASPELAVAMGLGGRLSFNPLTDPLVDADGNEFMLQPPSAAPEVPPTGFDPGADLYLEPPEDGSEVDVRVDPTSNRLQVLDPWEAWDGKDFEDVPILVKTQGKTTTDHISPAGPWLRFRGHLNNLSDNMFLGASNAFTDDNGTGKNQLSGEEIAPIPEIARAYKAQGIRWVAIGDENYGEGSSREHAAMSPRMLGAAAIITRSFARIHESNLKKQGLLPLTFEDSADWERIRDDDRMSLVGLDQLAPGRPVQAVLKHADGSEETINLRHTLNNPQIEWFKAGSAMNYMKQMEEAGG